jgi:hypothetical protein
MKFLLSSRNGREFYRACLVSTAQPSQLNGNGEKIEKKKWLGCSITPVPSGDALKLAN